MVLRCLSAARLMRPQIPMTDGQPEDLITHSGPGVATLTLALGTCLLLPVCLLISPEGPLPSWGGWAGDQAQEQAQTQPSLSSKRLNWHLFQNQCQWGFFCIVLENAGSSATEKPSWHLLPPQSMVQVRKVSRGWLS